MPQCTGHARARRKKLFARISSTFIKNKPSSNSSILESGKMLHSKSTYFYRWGSRLNYVVPGVCTLALLMGGIITFNPALDNSKAHAEELDFNTANNISTDTANADSGIMTASGPSITLDIAADSGNTNSNVTVGEVAYFSNTVTVGGTGINKYYLALSTPNGSSGHLVGKEHPASTVGKVNANTIPAKFDYNTWGYAVSNNTSAANDSLLYNPVPSGTDGNNTEYLAFKTGAPATDGDKYKLVFAAKLGSNMPSDHYQSSVYVSAVADAGLTSLLGLTNKNKETILTMQEMSTSFCTNVEVGQEGKLIDSRDGKVYFVAKLADNNCWMTQNLDFDIPATLSEETSDVKGANVITGISGSTAIASWPGQSNTANNYHDPENIFYTYTGHGPIAITENKCSSATAFTDPMCTSYFTKISTPSAEDMHYHVGNYYTWDAATVKSKSNLAGGESYDAANNATMSICPKGWQLPTSNNTNSKSFSGLIRAYNFTAMTVTTDDASLYGEPLYFVYSGSLVDHKMDGPGSNGRYWSSTPDPTVNRAYSLYFVVGANPSFNNNGSGINRSHGYPVRCVAQ